MSGDVTRTSLPSSTSTTPRSRLDALSRDELIYFVKTQVEKLKLSRAENAKLSKEIAAVTNALKNAEMNPRLGQQKETALYEKEQLSLQQENDALKVSINSLKDEMAELSKKLKQSELEKRNEELHCTVNELRCLLDDTNQELSAIKEKRNVENVFSLEIADYEKSVEKLQKELKFSKENQKILSDELTRTREELDLTREEKNRINTSASKMKGAIVKLKAELDEKRSLNSTTAKEIQKLEQDIDKINNEREEEKLQFSASIGEKEEKIQQMEENILSLNRQIASLRSVKEFLQRQYEDLLQEHNTFKARALYVLEQKKSNVHQNTDDQIESLEETVKSQKKTIENLMQSQRIFQDELLAEREHSSALSNKLKEVDRQMNSVIETHKKKLNEQRQQFEMQLASEAKLNSDLIAQIDANYLAYSEEKERLIKELNEEKKAAATKLEDLRRSFGEERKKLLETEHIKTHPNVAVPLRSTKFIVDISSSYYQRPQSAIKSLAHSDEEEVCDKTLKEVLYGDDVPENGSIKRWEQFEEVVNWKETARKAQKQLENIREILSESEAANARLMEQTKLLKTEIRRMEHNDERTDHIANTEYLKNIIIKFIAPEKVDSEREQLIPVLATMLRLNTDELQLLNAVVQADSAANISKPSGWGSYLHRWSGLS